MTTTDPTPETTESLAALADKHWLKFDRVSNDSDHFGHVIGCHCGYTSDLDDAMGWGDDVVKHLMRVAFEEGLKSTESKLAAVEANGNWQAENGAKYMGLYGRLHNRVVALIEECLRGHDPVQQSLAWEFRALLQDEQTRIADGDDEPPALEAS
ncbi:MAG: hypothetical protein ACRDS9_10665 [Pseudonocardiaceae bacterium]